MGELRRRGTPWQPQIEAVARRQWGVVSADQLRRRDVSRSAAREAVRRGRLFLLWRGVFSVAPPDLLSGEGRLAGAVLAGRRGAVLCCGSAGGWMQLSAVPETIHVATCSARKPIDGIEWHSLKLRPGEAGTFERMPVTSPARTALDLAATESLWTIRRVLAELEYRFGIDPAQLQSAPRRGHAGSARLREAIESHIPQLAETRSHLEEAFLRFLHEHGFPMPSVNHSVEASTVDALFPDQGLVVELDGVRGHAGKRRILRDHRRDLHRRADGLQVVRYHYAQIRQEPEALAADLARAGLPRRW